MDSQSSEILPNLPEDRYDLRILSSLRQVIRSIDSYSRRLAADHGMTVPQLLCMLKVQEHGAMTVSQLAGEIHVNPSTLVGIVDRLERSGIFARQRSEEDRRRVLITITEKGRRMVAQAPSPLQQNLVDAIERLPEAERATIALSLERICACIHEKPLAEPAPNALFAAPILDVSPDLADAKDISPRLQR